MEIAALRVKIMFQKNEAVADGIGNHRNVWADYYGCHATVSGEGGTESTEAGTTTDHAQIAFTVRFCRAASRVDTTGYQDKLLKLQKCYKSSKRNRKAYSFLMSYLLYLF